MNRKENTKDLLRMVLPALAMLTALAVTVNLGMLTNAGTLDGLFGRGNRVQEAAADTGSLNADYYPSLYSTKTESRAAAAALAEEISDEGIVLLKNSGLLPLSRETTVSPFGLRYCLPYYGSSGTVAIGAGEEYIVTPGEGLRAVFPNINTTLESRLLEAAGEGSALADNPNVTACHPLTGEAGNTLHEFSPGVYLGMESACAGTVGIVFIGRRTGENADAAASVYDDGTPHMLALTSAERETVAFAKAHCAGVVVVLTSPSIMEIAELEDDPEVGAILWLGGAGCSGYASLGGVLVGNVVPSGRTVDTWPSVFKADPTFANQDDGTERFTYSNVTTTLVSSTGRQEDAPAAFREYEEGVYLGYRYYETAFDLGFLTDYNNRQTGVLYPFGYGLSYTTFSQEIIGFSDRGPEVQVTVRVRNTGTRYPGKDVVQLYMRAPYTGLDVEYGIEKPTAVLLRFGKTGLLQPGEYEDMTLSFSKEEMASYCETRDNGDGTTGCYMLEAGHYVISIRGNAHEVLDSKTVEIPFTIWYDNGNPRQSDGEQAAVNQFPQLQAYMTDTAVSQAVALSRADWAATQPTAPTAADRQASGAVVSWIQASDTTAFDAQADPALGNVPASPVYQAQAPAAGVDNGLVLADLRGKDYDDPMWDQLLDQISYDDTEALRRCLFEDAYQTGELSEIGKPKSVEHDGPQGLTLSDLNGNNWIQGVCAYPAAPVMGATWNLELLYRLGNMVGQEALLCGIDGWYAPGLNLHRSAFGGRVGEYFSEDPVLAGMLGERILSGAGDAGLCCVVKHLGPLDTEAHRSTHTCVWMTEQALREIYLRPFEIALKNASKTVLYTQPETGELEETTMSAGTAVMTGDCGIGTVWTAANYPLLTGILRGEWGFQGTVISDIHLQGTNEQIDNLLRAGCDSFMSMENGSGANATDYASATGQHLLRRAVKNLCYTLVNTNLTQNAAPGTLIRYELSPWLRWLIAMDIVTVLLILGAGVWLGRRVWRDRT